MKKIHVVVGILVILIVATGIFLYTMISKKSTQGSTPVEETQSQDETDAPLDPSIAVALVTSKTKSNTVVLTVKNLSGKMTSVGYEFSYDSNGLIKGVNSGSKPIDLTGKDTFDREVYLGTCSRNDCKPDVGVKKVTVSLEFTDASGKKYQFSKEYDI